MEISLILILEIGYVSVLFSWVTLNVFEGIFSVFTIPLGIIRK